MSKADLFYGNNICLYYVLMLNCKINGTIHLFFLKSHISVPGERNCPNFFSRGLFPSYFHVVSDFCHIWGPFVAKIEKMCQKSAFLVVPSQNHWKWPTLSKVVQAPWSKKSYFSDFSINIEVPNIDGKIRKKMSWTTGCIWKLCLFSIFGKFTCHLMESTEQFAFLPTPRIALFVRPSGNLSHRI